MIDLFPAIRDRYEANATLNRIGRVLTQGSVAKETLPRTTMTVDTVNDLSTFGADIEQLMATITLESKRFIADDARTWLEAMRETFDDADLLDPFFRCVGCRVVGESGPDITDEQYRAATTIEVIAQREMMLPTERGI